MMSITCCQPTDWTTPGSAYRTASGYTDAAVRTSTDDVGGIDLPTCNSLGLAGSIVLMGGTLDIRHRKRIDR